MSDIFFLSNAISVIQAMNIEKIPGINFHFRWHIKECFFAVTCCFWHPKVIISFVYSVSPNTTNSVGWEEARDWRGEHFNGLCIPRGRQLSLLFSRGDHMSGSATGLVTHSYHDSFWWELGMGGGTAGKSNTLLLTGPPWRGVRFCEIEDLVDCISTPPWQPPMWLSCSVENAALKASSPHRRRVQGHAQRAWFVWALSLTTRTAPHLNLMDPTYAVITMPTSCQLWCGKAFVPQTDATVSCWSVSVYNKSPPQRSHQSKMLLLFSEISWLRGGKNSHWHLIVKTEYIKIRGHLSPGQIKAYLVRLDRLHTKSVGSCSLVDFRGLSRQKGIRKISKLFALQSWHCLV